MEERTKTEEGRGGPPEPGERGISRRKDPDIREMADTLEHLEAVLSRYTRSLREELAGERARRDPYSPLVVGLEGMIGLLGEFAAFIDEEVWTRMVTVADRSTSHVHRRTRNFF